MSLSSLLVRDARPDDLATIVSFNVEMARETESKELDEKILSRGVKIALAEPDRLRYFVAEVNGNVIGQAALTREWSDWRNGWIWWFQSVYVAETYRRNGVFRALYSHVRTLAFSARDVIGLRLYVEHENRRAHDVYQSLGMSPGGYLVFEELWPERFGNASD